MKISLCCTSPWSDSAKKSREEQTNHTDRVQIHGNLMESARNEFAFKICLKSFNTEKSPCLGSKAVMTNYRSFSYTLCIRSHAVTGVFVHFQECLLIFSFCKRAFTCAVFSSLQWNPAAFFSPSVWFFRQSHSQCVWASSSLLRFRVNSSVIQLR